MLPPTSHVSLPSFLTSFSAQRNKTSCGMDDDRSCGFFPFLFRCGISPSLDDRDDEEFESSPDGSKCTQGAEFSRTGQLLVVKIMGTREI